MANCQYDFPGEAILLTGSFLRTAELCFQIELPARLWFQSVQAEQS